MPSNEKQLIQQARFTYSPLGKAFEKQKNKPKKTKAIEGKCDYKLSLQKETYNKLLNERMT